MAEDMEIDQDHGSIVVTESPKKKRKHAEGDGQKSSKKKRKHEHEEHPPRSLNEDAAETPTKTKLKEKHGTKKKKDGTLGFGEPTSSHAETAPEAVAPQGEPVSPAKTKRKSKDKSKKSHAAPVEIDITSKSPEPEDQENGLGLEDASVAGSKTLALSQSQQAQSAIQDWATSSPKSPFYSRTVSMLVPLPPIAISLSAGLSSLLAQHVSPLLLTYHPTLKSIVLAFSNSFITSNKPTADDVFKHSEQVETNDEQENSRSSSQAISLAHSRDEHGVSFIWLTTTFLLFSPKPGDELEGYINVQSEGNIGLISYNFFQVSVGKDRIPSDWKWNEGPGDAVNNKKKKSQKTKIRDEDSSPPKPSQTQIDDDGDDADSDVFHTAPEDNTTTKPSSIEKIQESGFFTLPPYTTPLTGTLLRYRVIDTEIIPGISPDTWGLQIQGSLLPPQEEEKLRAAEKERWEAREARRKGLVMGEKDGARGAANVVMTGALEGTPTPDGDRSVRKTGEEARRKKVR